MPHTRQPLNNEHATDVEIELVCPGLSCPVCLSVCLSVTLVYCGQTVGWIKMKLGMEVGLGPVHTVLDGDPAPPNKGHSPTPNVRPMFIVAKRLIGSRCNLVRT